MNLIDFGNRAAALSLEQLAEADERHSPITAEDKVFGKVSETVQRQIAILEEETRQGQALCEKYSANKEDEATKKEHDDFHGIFQYLADLIFALAAAEFTEGLAWDGTFDIRHDWQLVGTNEHSRRVLGNGILEILEVRFSASRPQPKKRPWWRWPWSK